jgi:DNA-binding MarR family transcriptional regulator
LPKDLNTSLRFGFLIHDVSRLRRVVIDRALKPMGVTRAQWWVLAFLSRHDGMTQTALAAELDLTKVAVGKLMERLEAAGFSERRSDAVDARARRVYLTKAGHRLVREIRANVEKVESDILAEIDDAELNLTAATLLKIKETLLAMAGGEANAPELADEFSAS